MALVLIQKHRHWLSDTLLRYGLISAPLPGAEPERQDDVTSVGQRVDVEEEDEEVDQAYLTSLDPRNWKEQDHYAILGLKKKRCSAREEEIRRNYRRMILHHHPDKRGHVVDPEQDYFACITKAFEILGDPVKRRSYDSVDPNFDDEVPVVSNSNKKNFFTVFAPVFARNARWSTVQAVPLLGDADSSRQQVDDFYRFWYNFDSWREYSYQDEEDKERGQDREERRWIEKENRAVRLKKKKEEMARIRSLVDNAYACDPRIPKFREQDRQTREEEKRKKQEARKQLKEEEERRQQELREAARLEQEKKEQEERLKREAEKKEREAVKRIRKKVRRQLESVLQECAYFEGENYSKVQCLIDFDRIFLTSKLEEMEQLSRYFEEHSQLEQRRDRFMQVVGQTLSSASRESSCKLSTDQNSNHQASKSSCKHWSVDDCFLLTKAAKIFPPGTQDRWDVITAYFNQHSVSGVARKAKEVMAKSKELQDPNSGLRDASNKSAMNGSSLADRGSSVKIEAQPSLRDQETSGDRPWSAEEQKMLEQALITFPKDTPKRWDRIGESIPSRSKEQCIRRFKELASMVQAKREAQRAAALVKP